MTFSNRPVIVIKIGSSTVMRDPSSSSGPTVSSTAGQLLEPGETELALSTLSLLADTLLTLRRDGFDVILVSSGAVAAGCRELNVKNKPVLSENDTKQERAHIIAQKQAFAAVGQSVLMKTYHGLMSMANQKIAQVLLTSGDLGSEYQYANTKNTLSALLSMGVIPIINENDTVATEELKYGDNDWLSALVSTVVGADWLFLLTDVDQLCTANPRIDPNATPIDVVPNIESLQVNLSTNSTGTQWGTGGMKTKISAARLATAAGVSVALIHGRHPSRVLEFVYDKPERIGTVFEPFVVPLQMERKRWLSNCLPPRGEITISKAAATLIRSGAPLTTSGVKDCQGDFESNSAVQIRTVSGLELARGISNYSSYHLNKFKGMNAHAIGRKMGFPMSVRVVHEENLALLVENDDRNASMGSLASLGSTGSFDDIKLSP